MAYRLIVEISEGDKLVVTHIFHGATESEARHYYESHMRYDRFLRECVSSQVFAPEGGGMVPCTSRTYWEVR